MIYKKNYKINDHLNGETKTVVVIYSHRQPNRVAKLFIAFSLLLLAFTIISCKKLVEIPPPTDSIPSSQTFSTDALATAAMVGVYWKMINVNSVAFFSGATSIHAGTSSDELRFFNANLTDNIQFQNNSLSGLNAKNETGFWENGFSILYGANSVIDGLNSSVNIHDSVKSELLGEAKLVRAFCNFYLCNFYGDIPLVNEINWRTTGLLTRQPVAQVYQQIIADLEDAKNLLASDYSVGKGQRIVPNKFAAIALLARAYLYMGDWVNAEIQAGNVIANTNLYSLKSDLNDVFKINSSEAIWQLQQTNTAFYFNATAEGFTIIPFFSAMTPFVYLTDTLLNSFILSDKRRSAWIDSTQPPGNITYYYPKKYQIGPAQRIPGGSYTEYYMVLRLAEQYLIRAEARAKQNKLTEAISDINEIRNRANLSLLPNTLTQQQVMNAIEQENKIEFFAEWGHRWLDLKRWGKADAVLGPIKGNNWQTTDQLYPIPLRELNTNPNLTQNSGY